MVSNQFAAEAAADFKVAWFIWSTFNGIRLAMLETQVPLAASTWLTPIQPWKHATDKFRLFCTLATVQFHNQPILNQQQLLEQLGNRSTRSINRLPNLILALTIWLKADQVLLSFCSYCLTIHLLKWEISWEFSDDDVDGNNQRRWLIGETAKKEEELRPSTN